MDMGPAGKGLSRRAYPDRGRAIAEAAADRLHRPLLFASGRSGRRPLEETLQAHADLVSAGKVRAIGASNYSAARLREALDVSRRLGGAALRSAAAGVQPLRAKRLRGGTRSRSAVRQASAWRRYYSLASGFLTGKYRSEADFGKSPRGGRMAAYLNDRGRPYPRGARRSGRIVARDAGAGGARLADRAARA